MSHGYRAIVPEECVFDRFEISHRATLFDLDRQYGDVVPTDDVLRRLDAGPRIDAGRP